MTLRQTAKILPFPLLFFQPFEVTDDNESLLNFDTSWGLFEETMSSNIATMSLIGSVLRDLERPSWNEVSTPQSTQPEALTIARRQVQVLQNQESLSKKLDHIISLLSVPVANRQAAIHVPPSQPAVIPANPPPIQEPVPCTMPPASIPLDESPNPPENTSNEPVIPVCQVPHEELFQLKSMSRSRANFAVHLLKRLFDPSELEGRNIAGVRGKAQVNPTKVSEIKRIVSSFFPSAACDEFSPWHECRKAMDEYLRRPSCRKRTQ